MCHMQSSPRLVACMCVCWAMPERAGLASKRAARPAASAAPQAAPAEGGAGLTPTVFTYTAAMRAALTGSLMERALQVRGGACPRFQTQRQRPAGAVAACAPAELPRCRAARRARAHARAHKLHPAHAARGARPSHCAMPRNNAPPTHPGQVWDDAVAAKCDIDSRLCTTLIEVCGRKGDTDRALEAYAQVRAAGKISY